jgi:hypothetical protein
MGAFDYEADPDFFNPFYEEGDEYRDDDMEDDAYENEILS